MAQPIHPDRPAHGVDPDTAGLLAAVDAKLTAGERLAAAVAAVLADRDHGRRSDGQLFAQLDRAFAQYARAFARHTAAAAPPAAVDAVGPVLTPDARPDRPHVQAWPERRVVVIRGYGATDTVALRWQDAREVAGQLGELLEGAR